MLLPNVILIELCTICNENCFYCPLPVYQEAKDSMRYRTFKNIINNLVKHNYKGQVCLWLFGEPMMDARLFSCIEYIKKKLPEADVPLNTNGFLLTEEKFLKLMALDVSVIVVQYYEKMSLRHLELKKLKNKYPQYRNKLVLFKNTRDNIRNRSGLNPIPAESINTNKVGCMGTGGTLTIDSCGNVLLCCDDFFSKSSMFGNVNSKGAIEIYNDSYFMKIREDLCKNIYRFKLCNNCNAAKNKEINIGVCSNCKSKIYSTDLLDCDYICPECGNKDNFLLKKLRRI